MTDKITLLPGDCLDVLATLDGNSIDACVTDPPYHLTSASGKSNLVRDDHNLQKTRSGGTSQYQKMATGFMGKQWDGGDVAFRPETWAAVYRVLKPGAHLVAFGGTRTYHRMACAIEDAGFKVRDCIMWLYGSGFPKSHDVSKGIDRAAGVERENKFADSFERRAGPTGNKRCDKCGKWLVSGSPCQCPRPQDAARTDAARQWQGWGTALKPAAELCVLARKPLSEKTVASNVLRWGTGAINVDGCRVQYESDDDREGIKRPAGKSAYADWSVRNGGQLTHHMLGKKFLAESSNKGRWPANVILQSDEDEYELKAFSSQEQKRELYRWLSENA